MNNKRPVSTVLLMNGFDKVDQVRNVLHNFVVGPEFEMHMLDAFLFT